MSDVPGNVVGATIDIEVAPEHVWAILTDFAHYAEWNPFTPRVMTTLSVGAPVDLWVVLRPGAPTIRVRQRVSHFDEGRRIAWQMRGIPRWILANERSQWLLPLEGRRTRYCTTDAFLGLLAPLVLLLQRNAIERGFDAMAEALKRRAEGLAAQGP